MRTLWIALLSLGLTSTAMADEKVTSVTGRGEVQLQNLTAAVKSLQIKLEGSQLVKTVLDDVGAMTQNIIDNSRPRVEKVSVSGEPVAMSSAVFEDLQVLIKARAPEVDAVEQIYTVFVELSDSGNAASAINQDFAYNPAQKEKFRSVLADYLRDKLNLQPRHQTAYTESLPAASANALQNKAAIEAQIKVLQDRIARDTQALEKLKAKQSIWGQ